MTLKVLRAVQFTTLGSKRNVIDCIKKKKKKKKRKCSRTELTSILVLSKTPLAGEKKFFSDNYVT